MSIPISPVPTARFSSSNGFYHYTANASLDLLQVGDNPTEQFNITVTDSDGQSRPPR